MREFLFRGRCLNGGGWVEGFYCRADMCMKRGGTHHRDWIVTGFSANGGWLTPLCRYCVDPDTVTQYIGKRDKHGKKIFEGDILHGPFYGFSDPIKHTFVVYWDKETAGFQTNYYDVSECEVIGNIFDDPDLLHISYAKLCKE